MNDRMMVLGARIAEIEALYSCVLETGDPLARRRLLTELSTAGARLSADAGTIARATARRSSRPPVAGPPGRGAGTSPRLRRRIVRAQRTADWIIARADGRSRSR